MPPKKILRLTKDLKTYFIVVVIQFLKKLLRRRQSCNMPEIHFIIILCTRWVNR